MEKFENNIGLDLTVTPYYYTRETFFETSDKNNKNIVPILPWGATEPHNLHLPYLTDCILAKEISISSVKNLISRNENYKENVIVLPYLPMGSQNPGQTDYPFCIHYNYETQKGILEDIVISLINQKINKLVILNGHMGNCFKPMIRDLKQKYTNFDIFVIDWLNIPSLPHPNYFEEKEDHAGEIETSMMMFYHPELVNLHNAGNGNAEKFNIPELNNKTAWTPRNWRKITKDTGVGNPEKSSKEKGLNYDKVLAEEIANFLENIINSNIY